MRTPFRHDTENRYREQWACTLSFMFEKENPGYKLIYDYYNSYKGCYCFDLYDIENKVMSHYIFTTMNDAEEWAKGVVLE